MKALITGVTGYLGSRLAARLAGNCEVYGLVRQPLKTTYLPQEVLGGLTLLSYDGSGESLLAALEISQPDIAFHLAAYYTGAHDLAAVSALTASNLYLGSCLLEAMNVTGCRKLVYAVTSMAYWQGENYQPLNLYAATKKAFSDIVEFYTDAGYVEAASVMLSDTYGPDDQRPKVLNLIRQAILEKRSMDLTSGRQIFDLLYVDDVVDGLIQAAKALENPPAAHQFFQLNSENPLSLRETVELMLKVNHLKFEANWGGRPEPERQIYKPAKVYPPPPGWAQRVSLEKGLKRFWTEPGL